MGAPSRKYNPGFLTDDELVASYCVRTKEFELLVEVLRECTGASNPHQIVIGPRGSGKTCLLLRVAAEVGRDAALESRLFPIVFAEESYEVATAGEFWLECLTTLAAQAPRGEDTPDLKRTAAELRTIRDDQALSDRCLGVLLDFADREDKRLVLIVENLNMLFGDMADPKAGWRLRKILQTEPRIIVFASATSRFAEIDNPDRALYDLFRVRTLRALDRDQCAVLWESVSGRHPATETIRSLEILTGGSPRLISIVARFGAGLSFRDLMSDLFDLVDEHTEYFKSHIESLPAQERRVYLALATLWKPATTREIADHARLQTSTCSAQLARLGDRGVVQVAGGSARRKQYYLTERLYNIYYLLRRRRGPDRLVEALIHFMESFYSSAELRNISDEVISRFGKCDSPTLLRSVAAALANRGGALSAVNRPQDALEACDEVIRRFGESEIPAVLEKVAQGLANKAAALSALSRPQDALKAYDEMVRRFGESEIPAVLEWTAKALLTRAGILSALNRPHEELETCDEVVRRFGKSETPALLESVATALVNRGVALMALNRAQDALEACNEVVRRFGESDTPALLRSVATAAVNRAGALVALNRSQDAVEACDEVVRRFGCNENPVVLERVATALANKGLVLGALSRPQDALEAYDEIVRRFGESETAALLGAVAESLVNKGTALGALDRPEDALEAFDEVVRRFGTSEVPALQVRVGAALLGAAGIEINERQFEKAVGTATRVIERQKGAPAQRFQGHVIRAKALLAGGVDRAACEHDVEAVLALLPEVGSVPGEAVEALMNFTVALGPQRMRELIEASPSPHLLLPLTTALERELGLEPRVAREVDEVAQDIQQTLATLRSHRTRQVEKRED